MAKKGLALFICFFLFISPTFAKEETSPWQGGSIYSLDVNNFNNGNQTNDKELDMNEVNAYHGGDIEGVTKGLDYMKDMGFTIVALSSIFQKGTADINEHYGNIEAAKQLVTEAHKKKIKLFFQVDEENQTQQKEWLQSIGADGYYTNDGYYFLDENETAKLELQQGYYEEITAAFAKPDVSLKDIYHQSISDNSGIFLDNENTKRFTRVALENNQYPPKRLKLALAYLFTSPGVPIVYYGTDIALDGGSPPDNRKLMNFNGDEDFLDYLSQLGKLRNQLPSLQSGDSQLLYEQDGMIIIKKEYEEETVLITINNTSKDHHIFLSNEEVEGGKELHGMLTDDLIRSDKNGYPITSERETANIYVLQERTSVNYVFLGILIGGWILFAIFFRYLKTRKLS